jgi:hypothetical protein
MNAIIEIIIERNALGTISSIFSLKVFDLAEFYHENLYRLDASFHVYIWRAPMGNQFGIFFVIYTETYMEPNLEVTNHPTT